MDAESDAVLRLKSQSSELKLTKVSKCYIHCIKNVTSWLPRKVNQMVKLCDLNMQYKVNNKKMSHDFQLVLCRRLNKLHAPDRTPLHPIQDLLEVVPSPPDEDILFDFKFRTDDDMLRSGEENTNSYSVICENVYYYIQTILLNYSNNSPLLNKLVSS